MWMIIFWLKLPILHFRDYNFYLQLWHGNQYCDWHVQNSLYTCSIQRVPICFCFWLQNPSMDFREINFVWYFSSFSKKLKQTKTKTVTRYLHSFLLVGSKNIVDLFALLIILEYSIVLIITEKLDAAEKTRFH